MQNPVLEAETRRQHRLKRWVKRILLSFVLLLVVLAIVGATYQAIADHRDRQRFPQLGQSFDIGGFRLNLNCSGHGSPPVILESGLGVPAVGWELVQPEVAKFARVCSYDRAGYAWSDPGPLPRTSREIAKELHTLLQKAGIPPPYVLVGHSFGGFNVRVFNGLFPDEVTGMVLVDSSHEDQLARMPASLREANAKDLRRLRRMQPLMPLLIDLGIARVAVAADPATRVLPPDLREELTYLQLQPKYVNAMLSEETSFGESAREVRASGDLSNRPLIVLTAGKKVDLTNVPKADSDAFFNTWVNELQPSLARLSTRGRQIIIPNSDHMIPFEQPQALADAIRGVIGQIGDQ